MKSNIIDQISTWTGKAVAWLIPVLIVELVYDTIARYIFNAPTEWSYDISYMLYGTIFMLGSAYTLLIEEHVRIEIIYGKVSPKSKAIIDAICYILFFFPSIGALLYFGGKFALRSWQMLEASGVSMWSPPIYPFKTIIPLAAILLMAQGIVKFVRCIVLIFGEKEDDLKS